MSQIVGSSSGFRNAPLMSGYLEQRGKNFSRWKKFWFELSREFFLTKSAKQGKPPKKKYDITTDALNLTRVTPYQEDRKKKFAFMVICTSTTFYFSASSANEMEMWMETFNRQIRNTTTGAEVDQSQIKQQRKAQSALSFRVLVVEATLGSKAISQKLSMGSKIGSDFHDVFLPPNWWIPLSSPHP